MSIQDRWKALLEHSPLPQVPLYNAAQLAELQKVARGLAFRQLPRRSLYSTNFLARDIVSVQPMTAPTAAIFYLQVSGSGLESIWTEWFSVQGTRPVEDWMASSVWTPEERLLVTAQVAFHTGSHEAVSALLGNPQLSPDLWHRWCWVNPNEALQNPALPLFLLEDGQFLQQAPLELLKVLISSPYFPPVERKLALQQHPDLESFLP